MTHVRTKIREALRTLFEAVEGLSGFVVFETSEIKEAVQSPWVVVRLGTEQVTPRSMGNPHTGRQMLRQVQVVADIHTRGKGEAVEQYERIAAQLEAAVFADRKLGGIFFHPMTLTALEPSEPDYSGSLPRHQFRLIWTAAYGTTESDPTVPA